MPDVVKLPKIMVAPNGARLTRADHPALPVTIDQIVETARACHGAGADGIHAHVRDADQKHMLDAALYRELLDELKSAVPDMVCQITTEAVGRYSPAEQRAVVRAVEPKLVSVALREMTSDGVTTDVRDFYHWCVEANISVQHILYEPSELGTLSRLIMENQIVDVATQVLFVLGRYAKGQISDPNDLAKFLDALKETGRAMDWAVCAFGQTETQILRQTIESGGKIRIGFENNVLHEDGRVAASNEERVAEFLASIGSAP